MNIQWYPGHMARARRVMKEDLKLIDLLIEVIDARAPISSRNPDIDELGRNKARLIILNKADLASETLNSAWENYFKDQGYAVVKADSRSRSQLKKAEPAVLEACREKIERDRKRGIQNRPVRAMVAGIPNVGKSTFINSFAGKASARTGNKPGVTKGNQWIRLNRSLELLDTPGLLWPRFDDPQVGLHLALIGSVNDRIINSDELAAELLTFTIRHYPAILDERYGINAEIAEEGPYVALEQVAKARVCLLKGGGYDIEKAAKLLLEDYRGGRLGRITLEFPPVKEVKEQEE